MAVSTATIKMYDSTVNSGVAVVLNGAAFDWDLKLLTEDEPAPGKFDKVSVNRQGISNPKMNLTCYIDVDNIAGSNFVTKELLTSFAKSTSQTYLIIRYGGHGYENAWTNTDNTTDIAVGSDSAIKVALNRIRIRSLPNADNGHVLQVSIELTEDL